MLTESCEVPSGELPASSPAAVGEPAAGRKRHTAMCGLPTGPKIMMVDDEKLNLYVVAEYLKPNGDRELISTNDPREALSPARRTRPDAVLLDIQMPPFNGLDILRQIRADDGT